MCSHSSFTINLKYKIKRTFLFSFLCHLYITMHFFFLKINIQCNITTVKWMICENEAIYHSKSLLCVFKNSCHKKKNNASYICHLGNDLIITKYTTPNSTRRGFVMVKRLYMYIAAGIINFLDHWGIYAIVSHWLIFMLWWSIDNALTAPGMIRWPIVGCSFTFLYNYISLFRIEVHTEVVDDLQKNERNYRIQKGFFPLH